MSFYIGREASKLWKRACAEITTEIGLLLENWKYVLGGLIFQYIHGMAAHSIHYFHRPGPILQDVGFYLLPELGIENAYISETVFTSLFLAFVLWTFHPFIWKTKKIYTVLVWCRVLAFLCVRILLLSFLDVILGWICMIELGKRGMVVCAYNLYISLGVLSPALVVLTISNSERILSVD